MLKGINRRIIEINRTNNEYFEKAILFVRSDKMDFEHSLLSRQADDYLKNLSVPKKARKFFCLKNAAIFSTILVVFAVIFCIVLNVI